MTSCGHDSGVLAKPCVGSEAVRYKCEVSRAITLSQELRKGHRGVKPFKPYTRMLSSANGMHETGIE